jgi:hypothetical protein
MAVSKADTLVDKGADGLQRLSEKAAATGGTAGKLAEPLARDAAFVRQMKPSLMVERARGNVPTDREPGEAVVVPPIAESQPKSGGPNPWLVVGGAFAAGILVARVVDWRGHAHPR